MRASSPPWFRRPHRLLMLFAAVTLLPAIGVVWLGATLLSQDRELAGKQLRDRLERQAVAIAADIARDLAPPSLPLGAAVTAADDPRAVALIKQARDFRSAGRVEDALTAWASMKNMDGSHAYGWPAPLSAGLARVRLLGSLGRTEERDREAGAIRADLIRKRWPLDAVTLETAWAEVATPAVLAPLWRARWTESGLAVHLIDPAGNPIVASGTLAGPTATLSPLEAGGPWTIRIASLSPTDDLAAFGSRRRQLLMVLSLAMFLVLAGAYFVARGIRRELAVAELQSKFVSAVSHELRTPLTSMSHLIELLRGHPDMEDARRARYYDAIEQEAGRLRRFVDQLLDFGRIDAGAARYDFEAADLRPIVDAILERFKESAGGRGHRITCAASGSLPPVAVDPAAFELALNNLLENAAKYSPADTPIAVGLATDGDGRHVIVSVRDYGGGIPRAEHETIFDKFVRGSAAQASGVRGTGVGLALAREIIRDHGGDVRVESAPGHGSTFTISLPVAVARLSEARPSSEVEVRG